MSGILFQDGVAFRDKGGIQSFLEANIPAGFIRRAWESDKNYQMYVCDDWHTSREAGTRNHLTLNVFTLDQKGERIARSVYRVFDNGSISQEGTVELSGNDDGKQSLSPTERPASNLHPPNESIIERVKESDPNPVGVAVAATVAAGAELDEDNFNCDCCGGDGGDDSGCCVIM